MLSLENNAMTRDVKADGPPNVVLSRRYVIVEPRKMMERLLLGTDACLYSAGERMLATTKDGLEAVASVEVLHHDGDVPRGMRLWFGFTVSNTLRRGTRLYCGVTDTNAAVLDRSPTFRHGGARRVSDWLEESLSVFMVRIANYRNRIAELKRRVLEPGEGDAAVLEAARTGLIAWSRMGKLDALRRQTETAWGLMQAFAAVVATAPPISVNPVNDQLRACHGFYRLLAEIK